MFNWLDIVLLVILLITVVLGFVKGLVRQLIGIAAVAAGIILGFLYYRPIAAAFRPLVTTDTLAHLLAFLTVFLVLLLAGWLINHIFARAEKGSIKFINHLLGGIFGMLKGALICGALVFALLVFPVSLGALRDSTVAPYCMQMTKAAIRLIPEDLKNRFLDAYRELVRKGGEHVERV